jgi:hypothetical protein
MLAITPRMQILVAVEAVDFRKGIDSLAELCQTPDGSLRPCSGTAEMPGNAS